MRARFVVVGLIALCAAAAVLSLLPAVASAGEGCANEALREAQGSAFLPDCRAYEMVSPPDKNGADVLLTTERTRVAENGDAFGFASLAGFGDAREVSVASDYISERTEAPGTSGWATHAIAPVQRSLAFSEVIAGLEPLYTGAYSPDLSTGVFFGASPVTNAPMVAGVPNLYRRTDLLSSGEGSYELISGCSLCEATGTPLPPISDDDDPISQNRQRPEVAGATPDLGRVLFESRLNLTEGAPAQPPFCNPTKFPFSFACGMRLYEWDHGTVRLAGILPGSAGAADASFAGQGVEHFVMTPDVISDGQDGHSRVFFTQPTDEEGHTLMQGNPFEINASLGGNLFMRVDHSYTEQLNVSERNTADTFYPAGFLDASKDGTRAFFMTREALTEEAPADGDPKIYMYDTTKSAGKKLTLVDAAEPGDSAGNAIGEVGVSDDGHYFYFMQRGDLLGNSTSTDSIYLWHDGRLTRVGPAAPTGDGERENLATGFTWTLDPRQSRVSADGHVLLFSTTSGEGLTGYDQGGCTSLLGSGCRELYVYNADTDSVACVSCNPSGAAATGMATTFLGDNTVGGTRTDPPTSGPMNANGSKVFFDSTEALVPQDTNGKYDAYEYDVATGKLSLLSGGASPYDSYFINADSQGDNVFIATRQRLVGWDTDESYDMYDVRAGGGFPEPPPSTAPCATDSCQAAAAPPALLVPVSAGFLGAGNVVSPPATAPKLSRAQRLRRALAACRHVTKRRRKRCEASARKRFGNAAPASRGGK
jgi:hypothetical protein